MVPTTGRLFSDMTNPATSGQTCADLAGHATMTTPLAVTIPVAVTTSGESRSKIYEAMKRGALPARKSGRRTLILYADLEAYLANLPIYQAGA